MNFHEKAHFVKADEAALRGRAQRLCVLRYASIRTFSEPTSVARCIVRSIFSDYRRRRILRSGLSLWSVDQVRNLRSHLMLEIRSDRTHRSRTSRFRSALSGSSPPLL